MTIAIATPTGNIGSRVTQLLIKAGAKITLLVRNPDKLDQVVREYATVHQGSLQDVDFVVEATQGAKALLWVTPYNFATDNLRAWQSHLGDCVAKAVQKNQIPYVMNISSNGAQLAEGMGPISGLHAIEQKLNQVATNIIHLRPGFFMENYITQLEALQTQNSVFMPIPGAQRISMIATRDIAEVAANWLLNRSWSGQLILGLHGPANISFDEAATIIGKELGKPITHVQITLDQFRQSLLNIGATSDVVNQYAQMWQAISHPDYTPAEPRTDETTTPTTLAEFVRSRLC